MWKPLTDKNGVWVDEEYISNGVCDGCRAQFSEDLFALASLQDREELRDLDVTIYVKPGKDVPMDMCDECVTRASRAELPPQEQMTQLVTKFGVPPAFAAPSHGERTEQTRSLISFLSANKTARNILVQHGVRQSGIAQIAAFEYVKQRYYEGEVGVRAASMRSLTTDMIREDLSLVIYDFHAPQGATINETKMAEYQVETFITQRFMRLQQASTIIFTHLNDDQLSATFPNAYWILNDCFTILEL